jgi:hypothetical protein
MSWMAAADGKSRHLAPSIPCVNGAPTPGTFEIWQCRAIWSLNNTQFCGTTLMPSIGRPGGGQTALPN